MPACEVHEGVDMPRDQIPCCKNDKPDCTEQLVVDFWILRGARNEPRPERLHQLLSSALPSSDVVAVQRSEAEQDWLEYLYENHSATAFLDEASGGALA
jgi:hypothetical protein